MNHNNFEVWLRVKKITKWKRQNDLADFLGITPGSVSGAKQEGVFREAWGKKRLQKNLIVMSAIFYPRILNRPITKFISLKVQFLTRKILNMSQWPKPSCQPATTHLFFLKTCRATMPSARIGSPGQSVAQGTPSWSMSPATPWPQR